ncbi:MAG: hypothetical protein ACTTJW_05380 [Sphaerochaeta sp.]
MVETYNKSRVILSLIISPIIMKSELDIRIDYRTIYTSMDKLMKKRFGLPITDFQSITEESVNKKE